jgi:bifunctional DNase/RNase
MLQYDVAAVKFDDRAQWPIVELRENAGRNAFGIAVSQPSARYLLLTLDPNLRGNWGQRPLSHELTIAVVNAAGLKVERVEIPELTDTGVFIATVVLADAKGEEKARLDARPSDALALALAAGAPVFVSDGVVARVKTYAPAASPYRLAEAADLSQAS